MTKSQSLIRQDCMKILNENNALIEGLKNSMLVVTGGTGFVGSWIAEIVTTLNDEFNFNTKLILIARNINVFKNNLPHLSARKDIELIASDVRQLSNFPMDANWVIHAATSPDVRFHASNPFDTASTIVDGTMSILKVAERLSRLRRLLFISSGLVSHHSDSLNNGLTEHETSAPLPTATFIYSNAKRFAEALCSSARAQSRVPVVIARPFSFIGPYQSLDTPWAQTTFLSDAIRGNHIRLQGDGKVVRSYLYGSDAAFWFLHLLVNGDVGDVINVGSEVGITLQDLAINISSHFQPVPEIVFNTSPKTSGRPIHFLPNTSHARENYGLKVFTELDDAIKSTVVWHMMQNSNSKD